MNEKTSSFKILNIDKSNTKFLKLKLINDNEEIKLGKLTNNFDLFLTTYSVNDRIFCKYIEIDDDYINIIYVTKETKTKNIDLEYYNDKLQKLLNKIQNKTYKKICDNLLVGEILNDYLEYPASKKHHHAYEHGLLQHSIEVTEISLYIAKKCCEDKIDFDLLITGALLHDIGKIGTYEFDKNWKIDKNEIDDLIGHLSLSSLFLSKVITNDIDKDKVLLLYHIILSHHGKFEFGSPTIPKTREALIIHEADYISSKLNHLDSLTVKNNGWTEFDKSTERSWKLGDKK